MEFTTFYGIKICDYRELGKPIIRANDILSRITEYLSMNGFTFDTNRKNVLFVCEDEIFYVLKILRNHNIKFEAL